MPQAALGNRAWSPGGQPIPLAPIPYGIPSTCTVGSLLAIQLHPLHSQNPRYALLRHYSFIIMVKGLKSLVNELILSRKGTFENKWAKHIDDYDVYGTTVPVKLYEGDEKIRYFHIYHNIGKEGAERATIA